MTWNAPGDAVPIVLDCVTKAGFKISQVKCPLSEIKFIILLLIQYQVRKKEDQMSGAIWDSLPITEKEKDEICFQNLNSEVIRLYKNPVITCNTPF